MIVDIELQTNEIDLYGVPPAIEIAVPLVAVDNFLETLEDPATNSIAEIKLALKDFLNEMKAG